MSFSSFFSLIRWKLSLIVAASALAGFLYSGQKFSARAFAVFLGVALLAGAGSAINQVQEKCADGLMDRTKKRPLPAGKLTSCQALSVASGLVIAGFLPLYFLARPCAAILGCANLIWYNAIYTPLKKRTEFSVLIGSVNGALPPILGCIAAGGAFDERAAGIGIFMYLWQIGHFLLLLLRFGDDYNRAGIRTLLSIVNKRGLRNILAVWILGTAACAAMFPALGILRSFLLNAVLIFLTGIFSVFFLVTLTRPANERTVIMEIRLMYVYQGAVLVILAAQGLGC
jgi:protoheme IX farnesyltransferase